MKSPYLASRNQASRFARAGSGAAGAACCTQAALPERVIDPSSAARAHSSLSDRPLSTRTSKKLVKSRPLWYYPLTLKSMDRGTPGTSEPENLGTAKRQNMNLPDN